MATFIGVIASGPIASGPIAGGEQARGFWFNVNAELIIYGATEPDASVTIGGRKIRLRPDGTFSYRFALPDGKFDLPAIATNAAGNDARAAELRDLLRHPAALRPAHLPIGPFEPLEGEIGALHRDVDHRLPHLHGGHEILLSDADIADVLAALGEDQARQDAAEAVAGQMAGPPLERGGDGLPRLRRQVGIGVPAQEPAAVV